ncbi:uncharacterized protein LOC107036221 isoform X2 [Diachasma alloeum]|uniref:uncharacterized protein LOC107036221 isoform X2 n=1 Tax=Diachasma alloeum TaxID=454923 RepID=UPI00073818B0|nr:uncharacterized protein LOC107036221 isoform X2 [Diachasma alloeum]
MAPRAVKKLFNPNIFHIDGVPMRFYLEGYDECQCHQISTIIEAHGGKFSLPDTGTIVFSEPGRYAHTDRRRFHIKCLRDSIVQNKLQDINKYALPWRITRPRKDSSPLAAKIPKSESDKKPLKESLILPPSPKNLRNSQLREPYVLIQDCVTTHAAILKQPKLSNSDVTESQTSRNPTEGEQSSVISSSQSNVTPPFVQPKTADKPSPIATKPRSVAVKRLTNFRPCGLSRRPKSPLENVPVETDDEKRMRENLRSPPLRRSPGIEIIKEIQRKSPVVKDIIVISDSEDSSHENARKKGPEPAEKCLQTPEPPVDWRSLTNFDVPNSYAVWSRAGPPGPPNLSDSDGEGRRDGSKMMDVSKIKKEKESSGPKTREQLKRIRYDDWDTSDSDGPGASKSKSKKKKKRKSSYECDQSYKNNRF